MSLDDNVRDGTRPKPLFKPVAPWQASGHITDFLPVNPQEFSKYIRQKFNIRMNYALTHNNLRDFIDALGLRPVAFYNQPNHWTLLVDAQDKMRVYDPTRGIVSIDYAAVLKGTDSGRTSVIFLPEGHQRMFQNPDFLQDKSYWLPIERLTALGSIQRKRTECGDMCVYAAAVAKRKI